MGERRVAYRVLVEKPEGRRPLGRARRRWGIILIRILKKWHGGAWTGSIQVRTGAGRGLL